MSSAFPVVPVWATPCSILKVSLPEGFYHVDLWLCESYVLNLTGAVQTFVVRIALNDVGYNNLVSLVVNGTSVPRLAFKYGTPKPYKAVDLAFRSTAYLIFICLLAVKKEASCRQNSKNRFQSSPILLEISILYTNTVLLQKEW